MESGRVEERFDVFEGVGHGGGKKTFKVGNHPIHATGQKAETSADAANEERVEAVESRKNLFGKIAATVGLFAKKNGVDFLAVEENHPVARQFRMENGNEIDGGASMGRFTFGPNTDGIEALCQLKVTFALGAEMVHVLEGGDEFALSDVTSQILNGVADGEHGLMVEEVAHIRVGQGPSIFSAGAMFTGGANRA